MKNTLRATAAALLIAGGLVATAPPAEAATCKTTTSYSPSAMWVKVTPSGCSRQVRAVLYYFMTPKGVTTYNAKGSYVGNGSTSKASTSTDRYYAGMDTEFK